MNEIKVINPKESGVPDGVEVMANCSFARFDLDRSGKPKRLKGTPELKPCKIMASYSDGIISFSVHQIGVMVSVRIDEVAAVLLAASSYNKEALNGKKDTAPKG